MEMTSNIAIKHPKIVVPPRSTGSQKLSISLKAKQITYIKRKARENNSNVSQVIQTAIDVMESLDSEMDREVVQEI